MRPACRQAGLSFALINMVETTAISTLSIWLIAKIFVLIAMAIYIVFAFVVVRQAKMMTDTLEIGFEAPIKFLALGHLFFAVGVFILALLIL